MPVPADPRAPGNPVPPDEVRAMFDRIAPRYDAMNAVMTLGLDRGWRRAAASAAGLGPGMAAIDVACGSGALTRELARRVGPEGRVVGVDAATRMLARAGAHRQDASAAVPTWLEAEADALPLPDATMDAATIAFGLRNVPDYGAALRELVRVTRPGGRVVILELATPTSPLGRLVAATWFRHVVPRLGRLAGAGDAYRYLPTSVDTYPSPARIADALRDAGTVAVRWWRLGLGMVTIHVGTRQPD
jgi:demethylmenaquinone methyltransferase/2-methoxy-6-polyprenyl-1,4-benzoquinol methylase